MINDKNDVVCFDMKCIRWINKNFRNVYFQLDGVNKKFYSQYIHQKKRIDIDNDE